MTNSATTEATRGGISGGGGRSRAVVITAGGAGIGAAIAAAFVAAGDRVHLCDIDPDALERTTARLRGLAPAARESSLDLVTGQVCDVADEASVQEFVASAARQLGGIDVVVNNAGVAGPTLPVADLALADWQRVLDVGLTGGFLVSRAAIPHLRRSPAASLTFVSSLAGRHGYPHRAAYAVAKRGVLALVETLAMELGPDGIRVNAIAPGLVDGDRIQRVLRGRAEATGVSIEAATADALALQSLPYMVDPADIGALAVFLSSDAARSISGQTLGIDGGSRSIA